jgi:hypothetical protein
MRLPSRVETAATGPEFSRQHPPRSALHGRSADQRSIGWRIEQAPVPVGQLEHRRSHPMAVVRHDAEPASPGQWWWDRLYHVVRRDRERHDLVDDCRDLATRTPRAIRGRLVAGLEHGGGDEHQRLGLHLPLGLGLLDVAGLQRRHRADRVLRLILDPPWCGGGMPIRSASCAHGTRCLHSCGSAPPATPASTGTRVVTFLMG